MIQAKAERIPMTKDAFAKTDSTRVYWLGGGGAMINSRGTVILIDPLLKGFDMKLLTEAPILPEDVVRADSVVITHCDTDHFSDVTLRELKDRVLSFHSTRYVAGLFEDLGIHAEGHDINSSFRVGCVTITLTPADHAWQNEDPEKSALRHFEMEDFCGFRFETPDGTVWMPGDSRLLEEQLHQAPMDLILMDISDSSWHIGLPGVKKLAEAYPDTTLIPIHWGCVDAPDWKEFNGDPEAVRKMIVNPERLLIRAVGEAYQL